MYFSYDHLNFRYEPFPIGLATPLMEPALYQQFLDAWPDTGLFKFMPELGKKYALSQKFHSDQYHDFVGGHPLWREFHRWIKGDDFVNGIFDALRGKHIDLGYGHRPPLGKRIRKRVRNFARGRFDSRYPKLEARFEFQMMPSDGGHILPHTDTPQKLVTLVVSMQRDGEWNPAYGGGTEVNRHRVPELGFNHLNQQGRFEDMETLDVFEYQPNQAVMFVRTFNSWHCVRPMTGTDSDAMRKTLIINIEAPR